MIISIWEKQITSDTFQLKPMLYNDDSVDVDS